MIGTGFSFEDGEQILVSVQKPFGIVLEQGSEDDDGSAGKAGVREGDILVAVQNASTVSVNLGQVLDFIATKCPRVVNLRFQRME
jgi:C-terminal processing protease CtpA/Prc